MSAPRFDEIGYWSEIKLDIVRKYAQAYSTILAKQKAIQRYLYVDAFAGPGIHISRRTGEFIPGSPLNALHVNPRFTEYHFIDLDGDKAQHLRSLVGDDRTVNVHQGDCNSILLDVVFPRATYEDFARALCLLDPYGLGIEWRVVEKAGKMRSIELFLNLMVMDINRNVLWKDPNRVPCSQLERMDACWGDRSWRDLLYRRPDGLLPGLELEEKVGNEAVAAAYRQRLQKVAGFAYVPEPMPMRNSRGAIVYYLFFASPNKTGAKIVDDIFAKYRDRGVP